MLIVVPSRLLEVAQRATECLIRPFTFLSVRRSARVIACRVSPSAPTITGPNAPVMLIGEMKTFSRFRRQLPVKRQPELAISFCHARLGYRRR